MRFGTDGIRGVANADLSAELALACGRAVALAARRPERGRPRVVVGRDTRPSGGMLESALVAGLASGGADAVRAGVLPTAGVAFLTADLDADAGVVLSASHNPAPDNGIKVFGPGGWKLDEASESAIEALIDAPPALPTGGGVGLVTEAADAEDRYVRHLLSAAGRPLAGMRVSLDCAHGAAWSTAPRVLRELGADVLALHDTPDGVHINEGCGATHPDVVAASAASTGRIGLTLDGDADRVLAADETGRVVDGDQIVAILAARLRALGRLPHDAVALTVMSNQAVRRWCSANGIRIVETPVGDRHVLSAMREHGLVLGGEQSGHVVRLDHATTGDGILTAVLLLEAVAASGGRLADVVPFVPMPQVLLNVRVDDPASAILAAAVVDSVESARSALGFQGRVLVRASGTEPLVRVMVEAATSGEARLHAEAIARSVG